MQIQYCLNCGVLEEIPASGFKCLCQDREGQTPNKILASITDAEMEEWQEYKAKHGPDWLSFRNVLIARGQVRDTFLGGGTIRP